MTRDEDPNDDELARALRSATAPGELAPADLDALVAGALEAADVTPEEERAAAVLRAELDAGTNPLANALRAAAAPRDLPADVHARMVTDAVARDRSRARSVVRRVAFGTGVTAMALAAAVLLAVRAN